MFAGFLVRALLVLLPAFGLALGFAIPLLGQAVWQDRVWAAFTIPVLIVLVYDIVSSLRRGEVGLDIVAAFFDGCRSHRRRGVGSGRRRFDVCWRTISRSICRTPRTRRDDRAAGAGTSNGHSASGRRTGRGCAGPDCAGRPSAGSAGRCCPGRWRCGERACRPGSIRAYG